ncbi:MAG: autotransporter-associated beta strand repeat-containing protein, partial [Thermoguttaceae bacterium]
MFDNKPRHDRTLNHRRLLCESLEARTLLSVSLAQAGSAAQQQTLANLSATAQHAISSAIGQDQSAYHAASTAAGVTMANPANDFTAQLQSGALQVSAGSNTWDMSLVGLGYGGAVQPVATAQTSTTGNRVDVNYGAIDEWYVNGPGGLEQGFTIPSPPQSQGGGSLTVVLALGGDLKGTVNEAGDGLTLTRPDGSTALGYTGLTAADATGKALSAWLEVRTESGHQELLIHVNDAGAQGPITIDPFVQEAELTASDGAAGDSFGIWVSTSGNTAVVGVDDHTGNGAAYVFTEPASGWANMTQTAELTPSDGAADDGFGFRVFINGSTIVVGAPGATVEGTTGQGAAYVFTEPASGWANMTETAKLTASYSAAYDAFGYSISISGNTVVIGANDDNGGQSAAYVFTEPASGWAGNMNQTAKLIPSNGTAYDEFGHSVSISGNTVVVGADAQNSGQGAAYVFTEPASGWAGTMIETAKLTASDGEADDYFGLSASMSGNTLVVGAPFATVGGNLGQGAAYVFTEPASGWANMTQTAKLTASDGTANELFGNASVSISGNTVVVGANADNSGQGAAYVFTEPASGWANMTETAKLTASDGAAVGSFGASVSISGNTIVVGANGATVDGNTDQGAAYLFVMTPTTLTVTPADWTAAGLTLTLGSDGNLHVYTTGTTTDAVPPCPPASVTNIEITSPSSTTANLTIDSTNGDPIPAGLLDYSGAGGLIIAGSGSVTLSGTNSYTGGTTVSAGTLLINAASALPDGTSLTVGAGATFIFDPSSTGASSVTSATTATPVSTNMV